jgi:hypothetical protein
MLAQCNDEGFSKALMEVVIDYKCDETAVPMSNKYVTTKSGE